ncbi:MAG: Crp/Fnr family transcriptional regulator [Desulfobulbaceae bacterium]
MPSETPEWKFLRGLPQFSVLDDHDIMELATRLHKKKYKEGEYIFFQGDQVTSLFFLEMGKVEIYKSDINGKKLTLWFISEEEIFCLANLYALQAFASARVIQDAMIYSIEKEYFDALVARSGVLSRNLIRCLSAKLSSYSELLDDMAFKNIEGRLAKILLSRNLPAGATPFICSLTHDELASMAGTSREVIGRCLKSFRERGMIGKQSVGRKRCILIKNYSLLQDIADAY